MRAWCEDWLGFYGQDLQDLYDAVAELGAHDNKGSAQAAFLVLRYSASAKFNYLLRMVPPGIIQDAATAQDGAVLVCLSLLGWRGGGSGRFAAVLAPKRRTMIKLSFCAQTELGVNIAYGARVD
jgi:hypothetical protein